MQTCAAIFITRLEPNKGLPEYILSFLVINFVGHILAWFKLRFNRGKQGIMKDQQATFSSNHHHLKTSRRLRLQSF